MLMGNDCHDCSRYNRLEMKNVNKEIVPWLEEIVEENNSRIERNITVTLYMTMSHFVRTALRLILLSRHTMRLI